MFKLRRMWRLIAMEVIRRRAVVDGKVKKPKKPKKPKKEK